MMSNSAAHASEIRAEHHYLCSRWLNDARLGLSSSQKHQTHSVCVRNRHQTHPVCVRNRHQTHLRLSPGNCAVAWIRHASACVLGIRVTSANTQTSIRDDTLDVLPPTVNIVIISSLFWVSRQPKRHAHLLQNMNISELRIYRWSLRRRNLIGWALCDVIAISEIITFSIIICSVLLLKLWKYFPQSKDKCYF